MSGLENRFAGVWWRVESQLAGTVSGTCAGIVGRFDGTCRKRRFRAAPQRETTGFL